MWRGVTARGQVGTRWVQIRFEAMTEVLDVPVSAADRRPSDSAVLAKRRRRPSRTGVGLIVAAAAVWTAVLGAAASWRHNQFLSHRYDLGNMVQAVWSTAHGRPLEMTDAATGEQITRLGARVDPILVLLAPLWWIYPDPELLLVVQAAALAAGLYPAVCLALRDRPDPHWLPLSRWRDLAAALDNLNSLLTSVHPVTLGSRFSCQVSVLWTRSAYGCSPSSRAWRC